MSRPAPPILTVWHNGSQRTFTAGHDVIIGRDLRADVRVADPRISRAHLILRFEQGKWIGIDNGSVNGTFVNRYRRPVIGIHDGQSVNVGNARGPRLRFEIGARRGAGGWPVQRTMTWSTPVRSEPPAPPPRPAPSLSPSEQKTTARAGRPSAGLPPDQVTAAYACLVRWKLRLRR